ncbi:phosphoribosyltransferase [Porphyromonas gingivalis]|uniref:phosphoribosyltransferase n=2 Tax=Porphyromonas TaxID=836 RepID=UPI000B4E0C1B|nr:phosphoribosyltransferase [Porphyromonas gingivalis]MCE8191025.1 phosphoribosyltransferase [Porphyromonas gingivalis]
MYKKYCLMNYLPKRYQASEEEVLERNICYDFKDGNLTDKVKGMFLDKIQEIIGEDKGSWIVCFIPASSEAKTKRRYQNLASIITENGYCVCKDAIYNKTDRLPEHIIGKSQSSTETFGIKKEEVAHKKVLLIDDIITRGITFSELGAKLEALGATEVVGLFLAQTINPDFTGYRGLVNYAEDENEEYDDYYVDDDYDDPTYERYNGSYAQDVEGWSDQDIDVVFDGDPDAYWNID